MIIQIQYISFREGMLKALKRNQIIIFAIALMLITAGYLNYSMNVEQTAETSATAEQDQYAGIGDARLVSNNNVVEGNSNNTIVNNNETGKHNTVTNGSGTNNTVTGENNANNVTNLQSNKIENETKETSSTSSEELSTYFAESKLERDKMYSEMLESYQSILANSGVSSDQKSTSQTEISNINKQKNAIMIAENLIKNKGFKDVVIFMNNGSVSCVVRDDKLEEAEIAQIQSIIQRELGVNVENIHISSK